MPSRSADTAIAPRMRQYEHVQRRAERSPGALIGCMAAFIHGSLFAIRMNDYTLSASPARRMRASALLAANDRFRETSAMARGCARLLWRRPLALQVCVWQQEAAAGAAFTAGAGS